MPLQPFVLLVLLVAFGISQKQSLRYWKHAALAFLVHVVGVLLFHGGEGAWAGLFTQYLRDIGNDGPLELVGVVGAIGLGWVAPYFLFKRGYQRAALPVR